MMCSGVNDVIPAPPPVTPAPLSVTPAPLSVIPAEAGIHGSSPISDPRAGMKVRPDEDETCVLHAIRKATPFP